MSKVIGIDLGTANSCVAIVEEDDAVVILDAKGRNTVPSYVAIGANKEPLVGHEAKEQAHKNPLNTIFAVKRLIGRKFDSEEVQEAKKILPYNILSARGTGDAWVEVNEEPKSPEEISAEILVYMKEIAERHLEESVHHAVITVPAHFNDSQRQATKDAGRIAGLQVLGIINEPTAAALAYGLDAKVSSENKEKSHIVVFDLGGGTFDITILDYQDGVFDVRATGGDTYLGGEDLDLAIVNYLMTQFQKQTGVDLSEDKLVLQRLKEVAKKAKQDLSTEVSVEVSLPFISRGPGGNPLDLCVELSRNTLEDVVEPLLQMMDEPCLVALEDAGLSPKEIDDVILVGGMTRMPAVKNRCEKIFGVKPIDTINPDEAVARGAALQAALLKGLFKGMKLSDVIPLSLGIEVQGGKCIPLLKRNTKIPAEVTQAITTSAPNQTEVTIHILQGESNFAPDNKSLGQFVLSGLPSQRRGVPRIDVSIAVDNDGIVHVTASDRSTGEKQQMEIINSSGLDDLDLEQLVAESRQNMANKSKQQSGESSSRESEGKKKIPQTETNQVKAKLRAFIFQTQFALDTEGEMYKGESRNILEAELTSARKILRDSNNLPELKQTLETLQSTAHDLYQYLEAA